MKKERDTSLFLHDIIESIDMIERFIAGVSRNDFMKLPEKQEAVIRKIEIIGEAVKNLPKEFRDEHSHIPWSKPARTRDKLIHGYFGIDLDVVWNVAKRDLPKLKRSVEKLLK